MYRDAREVAQLLRQERLGNYAATYALNRMLTLMSDDHRQTVLEEAFQIHDAN